MKRFGILVTGYCAIGALVIPACVRPVPRLIWNASASVPVGLYSAQPAAGVKVGDLVAARPPAYVGQLMARRGYLPPNVPMLKHVGAVAGQRVCRTGLFVSIDGKRVARARPRDRGGRALPSWSGCRTLNAGDVFLLNPASGASFDGRYFGPVPARSIVAVLTPLWLRDSRDRAGPRTPARGHSFPEQKPRSVDMIRIGAFHEQGDGYSGRLETLGFKAAVTLVPATRSDIRNAPDYRVHAGEDADGPEIGAAWKRTGERAGAYLSVVIDDPQFARPLRASLFRPTVEGQPHLLFWQRNPRRRETEQQ